MQILFLWGTDGVTVSRDISGRITVILPCDLALVAKAKTILGHRWHPTKEYWSFPLDKIDLKEGGDE
ncbi:MAG: hypothetical protein QMD01_07875 [Thermodesulfovibrionales bacterium]|nr:hypothetical protein [Thermodesulfovibrionales bacterium]